MSITVDDGATITKDPSDKVVIEFDFDARHLAASAQISGTPTVTVVGLAGDILTTPLVIDSLSVLTLNRKVQCRVTAGAVGSYWQVTCHIVTNESPAQEFDKSVFYSVEQR